MSNNREKRIYSNYVHMFLALQKTSKNEKKNCIRAVIKDEKLDLKILEARLKVIGGQWRIHKTVNARNVEKAKIWLIKHLLDNPENASFTDSAWRTALLQKECIYGSRRFMLDIDTKKTDRLVFFEKLIPEILFKVETPNGWHYITAPFDTRQICEFPKVTLLRDGYYYVKTIGR